MRSTLKSARSVWRRLRFGIWARRLDLELRRNGGRLEVDAPFGAAFDRPPRIKSWPTGEGGGVTRLKIGRDVRLDEIYLELWAHGDNEIELEDGFRALAGVRLMMRGGTMIFGKRGLLRDRVTMKVEGRFEAGEDVLIGQGSTIHCAGSIEIDDRSSTAERVTITDSDHVVDGSDIHHLIQPIRIEPIQLGSNLVISAGVVILKGVRLHNNSVVAANAVLPSGEYEPSSVIAGTPAKVVKRLGASSG